MGKSEVWRTKRISTVGLIILAVTSLTGAASSSKASTTHYFYDAAGRHVGLTTSGTQIVRATDYDAADNRSQYDAYVTNAASSSQGLKGYESIFQGQALTSANGVYVLSMQKDGNAVLYHGSKAIWSSGTPSTSGAMLYMGGDGQLVVHDGQWNIIWTSGTQGNPGAVLAVQTDGNLVVYSALGAALWASNTAGQ